MRTCNTAFLGPPTMQNIQKCSALGSANTRRVLELWPVQWISWLFCRFSMAWSRLWELLKLLDNLQRVQKSFLEHFKPTQSGRALIPLFLMIPSMVFDGFASRTKKSGKFCKIGFHWIPVRNQSFRQRNELNGDRWIIFDALTSDPKTSWQCVPYFAIWKRKQKS